MSDSGEREARQRFHLALAGIFTFPLLPFISWWAALTQPKSDGTPWRRRLVALAIVDTLVFACIVALVIQSWGPRSPSAKPTGQRARIGVVLRPSESADGVEIESVAPASPAEAAGIRAGDKITSLDDKPVRSNDQFSDDIAGTPTLVSRRLHVHRGASELDVSVVPSARISSLKQPTFARASKVDWSKGYASKGSLGYVAALIVLAIVGIFGARRKVRLRPLYTTMLGLVAPVLVSSVVVFTFQKTIGLSLGAGLIGMLAGSLTMLLLGATALRREDQSATDAAPIGMVHAFGLGLFYAMAGAARAAIVVSVLAPLLHLPAHSAGEAFGISGSWNTDAIALFVLAGVIIAPTAEECLFRGVLLPWLTTWMTPVAAIAVSAFAFGIGHLYYGSSVVIPMMYGVALGWMRLRTGRLRASIALHMFFNGSATLVLLLRGSG